MRTYLSLTVFCLASAQTDEDCTFSLELLLIQDASGSFFKYIDHMASTTDQLVDKFSATFGEFKYGISSFIDKPMPTRGMGYYGNYASQGLPPDYCFAEHSVMTNDVDIIHEGQDKMRYHVGSGGDFPENPYEALIFAAYSKTAGWSAPHVTHSESGLPIARIALVVTDDIPHETGDAYNGATLAWGAERTYADYYNSKGGFGSKTYGRIPNFMFYGANTNDEDQYIEMCDLFRIEDLGGSRTPEEQARLNTLVTKFGPYPWPTIEDHPGDDSKNCNITDYPSLAQVATALNKHKVTPIFLVAEPESWDKGTLRKCSAVGMQADVECLKRLYTNDLNTMGYEDLVISLTLDTEIDSIVSAIQTVTKVLCLRPSTTMEPTTPTTPSTTTTTTIATVPSTTPSTTIATVPSTAPSTTIATVASTTSSTTTSTTTATVTSTTTSKIVLPTLPTATTKMGTIPVTDSESSVSLETLEVTSSESETTVNLSMDSSETSVLLSDLSDTTVGLSDTTVGLSDTTVGLSDTTVGLSDTTIGLSDTTVGLSDTTIDLSDTTVGLSDTTIDLSDTTIDLSDTTLVLSETTIALSPATGTTVLLNTPAPPKTKPIVTVVPDTTVELSTLVAPTTTTTTTEAPETETVAELSIPEIITTTTTTTTTTTPTTTTTTKPTTTTTTELDTETPVDLEAPVILEA